MHDVDCARASSDFAFVFAASSRERIAVAG
jgi:hypothetical protein